MFADGWGTVVLRTMPTSQNRDMGYPAEANTLQLVIRVAWIGHKILPTKEELMVRRLFLSGLARLAAAPLVVAGGVCPGCPRAGGAQVAEDHDEERVGLR